MVPFQKALRLLAVAQAYNLTVPKVCKYCKVERKEKQRKMDAANTSDLVVSS